MPVPIPPELETRRALGPAWGTWLDSLPRLVDEVLARWHLTPAGEPMHGYTALVLPVTDADGVRRALKVGLVDESNVGEIPTLQLWRGRGAVEMLRADPHRGALLLEWLDEGHTTTEDVAALYRTLHRRAAPQLPDLHVHVNRWLDDLEALGRRLPAPPRLVEQAILAGRRLAAEPGTHVLHGDLHYANVLARAGEWVAIDPKGHNGDPCFEPAPLLWNRWEDLEATGNVGEAIRDRFYTIVDTGGLDERRARDWVVVRCMVNVGWGGTSATRNITIAKAMQAVEVS